MDANEFAGFFKLHCIRCCIAADLDGVIAKAYLTALRQVKATLMEAEGASQWVAAHMPQHQSQVLSALITRICDSRRGGAGIKYVTEVAKDNQIDDEAIAASRRRKIELAEQWIQLSQEQKQKFLAEALLRYGRSLERHVNNHLFAAMTLMADSTKEESDVEAARNETR